MHHPGTIGLVLIEKYADWEFGLLAASAAAWFGGRVVALTTDATPARSMAGLELVGQRGLAPQENEDLDAVAVIGSEVWTTPDAPDITPLLGAVSGRGGAVGGICAGTLALARAGLFAGRRHTSNGRQWISTFAPGYAGAEAYEDVPHAVADGRVVSAPGSAPGTFAAAFLEVLLPGQAARIGEMRALFAREHAAG
ncbi:DJ-1/PfpI family protein [Chelativorans intermedius]|uniref:DJ-1/PfpI family protein n=1 Tax=Chelativorans intermedius TaxID=515947 RepID=A0ABV6D7G6_9HYPH|nr:DJ-1/PfpI family protein [Chelativorans intermedius]MCT8999258.1 DJ-1/PfpI family protein [Chelativorans intermedius]